jgi:hypothetical protein
VLDRVGLLRLPGRDGRRTVRNVGRAVVCLGVAGALHRSSLHRFAPRRRVGRGLPHVAQRLSLALPVLGDRRTRHRCGRRMRRRLPGGDDAWPRAVDSALRMPTDRRRASYLDRRRGSCRRSGGGLRLRLLRPTDRADWALYGGHDVSSHELERRRDARRPNGGLSGRQHDEQQQCRRCREYGGESATDRYVQLHPGHPARPQRGRRFAEHTRYREGRRFSRGG